MEKELQATNLETGLNDQQVKERLSTYGYNEVPEKKESSLVRLGRRFWGIVPWMLEASLVVTLVLGKYVDALVILALLLFNAGMSLWREGRARSAMAALKQKLRIQSRVKRNGKWSTIPARELVPGDSVRVRIGDFIPADVKIVEGSIGLDQSVLTGESGIVDKTMGEIAYSGSAVKRGEATCLVDATGTKTYFGKTVSLLELAKPKVHMEEVTVKVARQLAMIVVASLLIAFVYTALTGFPLAVLLPLVGVLLVASVPVSMPAMFTVNMALGAAVMAKQGVLVTRLSASEDAANMDVLCADKTGTITMNRLFVEEEMPVNGFNKNDVLLYGALASKEANQDPIDIAFLTALSETEISLNGYLQTTFVPFDPKNRLTEAVIQKADDTFLVTKGSCDAICAACTLQEDGSKTMFKLAEELSAKGLRTIAVAKGADRGKLELVGLAGIADRIREDSKKILEQIRGLGVEVKMLTNDALPIARNIAQQVGLGNNVTTMSKIQEAETEAKHLHSVIEGSHGISQIYPEDKFTIVKTLQNHGHIVGMTGDGVNDAPALGQAEVGIAVKNATDIAKDSASAVLTAEGLGGIPAMIKTSRTIYQRIYSWAFLMVARKLLNAGFIVAMLLLTHSLVLSITSTVLWLFLGDFAAMSMSTDNVQFSVKPDTFDVSRLFRVSGSLAALMTIESVTFGVASLSYFGLVGHASQIVTFGFAYLTFEGIFTLMIVRERTHFWNSRPSKLVGITVLTEILLIIAISTVGVLLAPIGVAPIIAVLAYTSLTTFLINDPIKVYLIRKFKTAQR